MEKRYYWLKFKDDFFDSKRVKKLRKMAGGDTYIVIYLKMQLKALRSDGVLSYTGLEENFADELALDIDESPEDVRMVLAYLMNYGLCECSDNIHYFLPYVVENTGSETATAQRMRDHRSRAKLAECNNVTGLLQERYVEKEKEKEIDKEIDTDSMVHRKRFTAPTKEEVIAYCKERGNRVDPERFIDYYTSNGWKVGKNPMKDWKAAIRTWEKGDQSQRTGKKRNTLDNYEEKPYDPEECRRSLDELDKLLEEL